MSYQQLTAQLSEVRSNLKRKQYYSPQQLRAFRRLRNKLLHLIEKIDTPSPAPVPMLSGERAGVRPAFRPQQLNLNL